MPWRMVRQAQSSSSRPSRGRKTLKAWGALIVVSILRMLYLSYPLRELPSTRCLIRTASTRPRQSLMISPEKLAATRRPRKRSTSRAAEGRDAMEHERRVHLSQRVGRTEHEVRCPLALVDGPVVAQRVG